MFEKGSTIFFPIQVVSSVKWLEDELELNALHNPGSRRGSGNEKAAVSQRSALSAALGRRVEVSGMCTISGLMKFSGTISITIPCYLPISIEKS